MKYIKKILKFEFSNVIRSRWVIFIFGFFFIVSYALFTFESNSQKSLISLFNLVIYLVPLIGLIFGTMYFYNSREYIELMLCQPIPRGALYFGLFLGTTLPLSLSLVSGILLPYILFNQDQNHFNLIFILMIESITLTFISISISFLISTKLSDKVKGLSLSLFLYLIMSIAFDGLMLLFIFMFSDYPIEKFLLFLSLLNPVNLSRTLFVLNFDTSALMGLTGAIFRKFYGSFFGTIVSAISLILWTVIPLWIGLKNFNKKDF
ncbi:MAG: ABC transporter permease subunit [Ignavibacteria bacterium]|nr:ABC transporter permease subunit [Ignavibacteria bacterium]